MPIRSFTAATEGSLDAILIVDASAHIVSYNQHFVELWQIPHELVAARIDAPVLEVVTSRTKDPAAFLARVKYLYDHPGEEGREKVETKDGRIIDRYSRPLHGPNDDYLGRIWFFRDVTEQERAAEALKQSEASFKAIFDTRVTASAWPTRRPRSFSRLTRASAAWSATRRGISRDEYCRLPSPGSHGGSHPRV